VILCDTGPLVALLIAEDTAHKSCTIASKRERSRLLTTDACLTEALHLLYRAGGYWAQCQLWAMVRTDELAVIALSDMGRLSAAVYMDRYADQPCDYADATLLVAAEDTGIRRIFTIDGHFYAYRLVDGSALKVIP